MMHELPDDFRWDADAVVIGASAGGIDALLTLLEAVPAGYPLAIVALVHVPEARDSRLAEVFAPRLALPVREAAAHAPVTPGTVFFAPNGYHLLVEPDRTFSLSCDPPVLFSRPSIDVLMESCADAYGPRLAGLVLTGASEDGARGLTRIRARGGLAAVQAPQEALHRIMPMAAVTRANPQLVLPLAQLAVLLQRLGARR
ncbi:chemotaxis protein CheB [Ramlibacter sp.]|uniref:chemotaxis protein CheB n=1 Tax=Ramlibacter sp. TaxID=1917967 RepID=UPI002D0D75C6|nr:chemotaxis protein CheB [Ramlibacter sp.]HWI83003.1 chemotaxis protein CheB [Ramlibacter sp.]